MLEYAINKKYCVSDLGDMRITKTHITEEIEQVTKIINDSRGNKFDLDIMIKLYGQFGGTGFNTLLNIYDIDDLKKHIFGLNKRLHDLDEKMTELINSTKITALFTAPTMALLGITFSETKK